MKNNKLFKIISKRKEKNVEILDFKDLGIMKNKLGGKIKFFGYIFLGLFSFVLIFSLFTGTNII